MGDQETPFSPLGLVSSVASAVTCALPTDARGVRNLIPCQNKRSQNETSRTRPYGSAFCELLLCVRYWGTQWQTGVCSALTQLVSSTLWSLESPSSEEAAGDRSGDPYPEPAPQGCPRQLRSRHFHSAFRPVCLIFMSFPPVHSSSPDCPSHPLQCQLGLPQSSRSAR